MELLGLITELARGIELNFPGGVIGLALMLALALLLLGARDLILKSLAYHRRDITMKRMILPLGTAFLILGGLVLVTRSFVTYGNQNPRPKSIVKQKEGVFPLYEKNFSKMISIDQHPYFIRFYIHIETPFLSDPKLDDVGLRLDAIKNGQVIGSQLIQGNGFYRFCKPEPALTHLYAIARVHSKSVFGSTESYFKFREPCNYRLTVIQPCEEYACIVTELRTARCY